MTKLFLIEEELANAILEYLSRQPYREVYKVMSAMAGLSAIPPDKLNLLAEHITANSEHQVDPTNS